ARQFADSAGPLTVAAFVEGGWSDYDSYNSFKTGSVHGSGNAHYAGGGLLLHQDWASGLYAGGIVRGGRIRYDWSSHDMVGASKASYDSSAPYVGASVELGYRLALSQADTLAVSGRYAWLHEG